MDCGIRCNNSDISSWKLSSNQIFPTPHTLPLPEPYYVASLDLHPTQLTSPWPMASGTAFLFDRVAFPWLQSRTYSRTRLLSGDLGGSRRHREKSLLSDVLSTCHCTPHSFTSPSFPNRLEGFGRETLSLFNYLLILGSKKGPGTRWTV